MIKIEHLETYGWEAAVRGMRNPMNSWDRSDSQYGCDLNKCSQCGYDNANNDCGWERYLKLGDADKTLMRKLCNGGPVHAKFRRMITVYCDITAPLYWWSEYDTYKVGTVANSCSKMHKLGEKEFELSDFSCEKVMSWDDFDMEKYCVYKDGDINNSQHDFDLTNIPAIEISTKGMMFSPYGMLSLTVEMLNKLRELWLASGKKDKAIWYQMIQLLPTSYNQKRTVELNYEVLAGMYKWRKDHKLDEWREFCRVMKDELPESWIFTGEEE